MKEKEKNHINEMIEKYKNGDISIFMLQKYFFEGLLNHYINEDFQKKEPLMVTINVIEYIINNEDKLDRNFPLYKTIENINNGKHLSEKEIYSHLMVLFEIVTLSQRYLSTLKYLHNYGNAMFHIGENHIFSISVEEEKYILSLHKKDDIADSTITITGYEKVFPVFILFMFISNYYTINEREHEFLEDKNYLKRIYDAVA